MKKFLIIVLIAIGYSPISVYSQPEHLRFGHLRNDHGLSQNSGRAIKQDKDGYIWIATESGLNKYDGRRFEVFRFVPGSSEGLTNNYLNAIETGRSRYVYIGTDGKGLDVYDLQTGRFFNAGGNDGVLKEGSAFIYSICETTSGIVLVGTGNGLFSFNPADRKLSEVIAPLSEGQIFFTALTELKTGSIVAASNMGLHLISLQSLKEESFHSLAGATCLAEGEEGKVYAGTRNGLIVISVSAKGITKDSLGLIPELKGLRINGLVFDPGSSQLWIATDEKGLFAVNTKTGVSENYRPEIRIPQSITTDKIKTLFLDQAGILWIGTYFNGVHFLNTRRKKLNPSVLRYGENFLTSITGVTSDTSGNIWLGTLNGSYCYQKKESRLTHFAKDEKGMNGPVNEFVTALFCDSRGWIWTGTDGGLSVFSDGRYRAFLSDTSVPGSIAGNSVWGFSEDPSGRVWIATWDGGVSCFDPATSSFTNYLPENSGLSVRNVNAVCCDGFGRVWVGTWEKGLDVFDPATGKWKNFSYNQSDSSSLSHNIVLSLMADKEGNIWAGTFGGGANRIDGKTFAIRRMTQKDGLADNSVMGLQQDKSGHVWAFTMHGASRIDPGTGEIKNFDMQDGLQGNEFSQNGSGVCPDGRILASGPGGFNYFDPDSVFDNYYSPPLYIASLSINNQPVSPYDSLFRGKRLADADTIELEWNRNSIGFAFVALHYANPLRIRYACKLEPFDTEWVDMGVDPSVRYTRLPPGEYTLLYKATNCDGIWIGEPKKLMIIIHPPYWQTTWFIASAAFVVLLLIAFVVLFRERTLRRRNRILERKVEERTTEINQQKEEIEAQRDEIEAQRDMVISQKEEITNMHGELKSSIRYAQRIQEAMLPSLDVISEAGVEYFLFFRPRDIVSGDFYWAARIENQLIITVADCTGHGVPGAFMSMLGIAFLREIVQKEYITQPAVILRRLRKEVVRSLKQREDPNQKDGMDIALCSVNLDTLEMQFAGANNPLYIVPIAIGTGGLALVSGEVNQQPATSHQQLVEIKGDKMPIGIHERMDNYTLHTYQLQKGDCLYLFSDGIADQFGGEYGKKMKYKALKELLVSISWQPAERQKRAVELAFDEWKGRLEQVDDVTLLGFRF